MINQLITQKTSLATLLLCSSLSIYSNSQVDQIDTKKAALQELMNKAEDKGINIEREKCVIWMTDEFSKYANWDENNVAENVKHYQAYTDVNGSEQNYKAKAQQMANDLPGFERSEIILMLDNAITTLNAEINGSIKRPDAYVLDWETFKRKDDQFVGADGETPIFIHDYFSKPKGFVSDYTGHLQSGLLSFSHLKDPKNVKSWEIDKLKQLNENAGYVMLWHGLPPQWAVDMDKDIREGQRNFTLYDIDNPIVRDGWKEVITQMVPHLVNDGEPVNGARLGYVLANEPHWYTSSDSYFKGGVSKHTMENFRAWLKEKYGSINNLNKNWKVRFATFDDVTFALPFNPNNTLGTAKGYDWQRFNMDRVNSWFNLLHSNITKVDPTANTQIKMMPHCWTDNERDHGLDFEYLTELTNVSGNDAQMYKDLTWNKGVTPWWKSRYAYDWKEMMAYDFYKSIKPDQPIINSEGHFLSTSRFRDHDMKPNYVRTCFWLATMHGMNSCYSWFWARETSTGEPSKQVLGANSQSDNAMASSYAASVVQQPRVANEVTQTYFDMNALSNDVVKFQRARRPLRIFYSETAAINNKAYMTGSIFPLYEALNFEGTSLGFATERIIEKQDPSQWNAILVYKTASVTDDEFAALQSYLDNGGTVIIDDASLVKNQYGANRSSSLSASKGSLIKVNSLDDYRTQGLNKLGVDSLTMILEESNTSTKGKGCEWRVAKADNGNTLMYIINLGKTNATLKVKDAAKGEYLAMHNMLNGQTLDTTFTLQSEDVLILEYGNAASGITDGEISQGVKIFSVEKEKLTATKAAGHKMIVSNQAGQVVVEKTIESDNETISLPSGVYVVNIPNVVQKKLMVI